MRKRERASKNRIVPIMIKAVNCVRRLQSPHPEIKLPETGRQKNDTILPGSTQYLARPFSYAWIQNALSANRSSSHQEAVEVDRQKFRVPACD